MQKTKISETYDRREGKGELLEPGTEAEEELQRRLRAAAAPFIGSICGDNPSRSENVRSEVRARLARKYGR
jgi:hypothetical protein